MNDFTIEAQMRKAQDTPRALRRAGYTPCVMYGRESAPESIQIATAPLARLINRAGSSLINITIDNSDQPVNVLIRDVQRDPVTRRLLHVDFLTVQADQVVRNTVPIVQHGDAPIELHGGTLVQLLDTLEIECLPADLPHSIIVDVSGLDSFSAQIAVSDLKIPERVTVLTAPDTSVIHVMAPMREEVEEAPETEEEEAEEAEADEES
ncbi:MAG: 50S ribosomal protein L25 [Chloroflexi bacterium]|nr:50S ribosomal protein L25 [Chloroflexota bacterium]